MSFPRPDHPGLQAHYEQEWAAGLVAFTEGTFHPDPVPRDGDPRFGLSLVVRAEGGFADRIAAESEAIAARCRGNHLNYVPRDLHMTVRSLEGFQDTVPQQQIDHYLGQLKEATEGLGPIAARFEGLGGSRGGLYVRGYPNADLLELRRRMRDARVPFGNLGPAGGDGDRYRDNAHVTLLVPREAVPEPEVAAYVDARTAVDFGSITTREIALVVWRPDLRAANIEVIERVTWLPPQGEPMLRIEWTSHERKPQPAIDELYADLQASIAIDGPTDFAVLVCATQLLETRYVMAHLRGFSDRERTLDYADIVELFENLDAALEALAAGRTGIIALYPGQGAEYPVFDCSADEVRLFMVPWLDAERLDRSRPLPDGLKSRPGATAGRAQLIGHLKELRGAFARSVAARDPRLAQYDPIRRWLPAGGPDE